MATNYPSALDDTSILIDNATNATLTINTHPAAHNNVSDAILAIETELGTVPKGGYANVKTRLNDGVVKTPGVDQIIHPSGDTVGLSVQASASQNTANLIDVRNNAGTILGYWDRFGNLSAAALKIAGTAISSSNLSDGPLAPLVSPNFTGSPVAPTASPGDSSSLIATTSFVTNAVGSALPTGAIIPYSVAAAPTGYLLCDGSAVSRTTYAALFALIGITYGAGNGTTTFNVPDIQGRVLAGLAGSTGHADVKTLGNNEGSALASRRPKHPHLHTLAMPNHLHTVTDPGHYHQMSNGSVGGLSRSAGNDRQDADGGGTQAATTGLTVGNPTTNPSITGAIGASGTANDAPAYLVVNYLIKT